MLVLDDNLLNHNLCVAEGLCLAASVASLEGGTGLCRTWLIFRKDPDDLEHSFNLDKAHPRFSARAKRL